MPQEESFFEQKWVKRALIIGGGIVAFLALVFAIITFNIHITITPAGGTEPLELVYGQDIYTEKGAAAMGNGQRLDVEISGTVDMTKLGSYTVTYTARYLWLSESISREVRVVDKTSPVITLETDPDYHPAPGEAYKEEGYTATDDYDGDITDKVQIQLDGDMVYYSVTDSSGNKATAVRQIVRKDVTPPVITLQGGISITINAGTAFIEPGYTAIDDCDGDITENVKVTGSVNIYHADTYTLTYTVADSAGNEATVKRTVVVKPIQQPPVDKPGDKVIYLTFDDGPGKYTMELLEILEKYDAKATFFVVNTGYKMKTILNAIVKGGHGIGIHSLTHDYSEIYASEEAFFKDLHAMQKIIYDYTGKLTTLMRFPGGSSNTISSNYCKGIMTLLTKAVQDMGFQYFDWNVLSGDAGETKDTDEIVANIISGIEGKDYAVVLQHDIHKYSVDAVEQILIWGIQNGYSFEALTPGSPTCHHRVHN